MLLLDQLRLDRFDLGVRVTSKEHKRITLYDPRDIEETHIDDFFAARDTIDPDNGSSTFAAAQYFAHCFAQDVTVGTNLEARTMTFRPQYHANGLYGRAQNNRLGLIVDMPSSRPNIPSTRHQLATIHQALEVRQGKRNELVICNFHTKQTAIERSWWRKREVLAKLLRAEHEVGILHLFTRDAFAYVHRNKGRKSRLPEVFQQPYTHCVVLSLDKKELAAIGYAAAQRVLDQNYYNELPRAQGA